MSKTLGAWVFAAAMLMLSGQASGETLEFPHAGLALAIPAGYELAPVSQPFDVMRAVLSESGQRVQAITVAALPLEDPNATAETLADEMVATQQENLAIRNFQVLSQAPMKVADLPGAARFVSYSFRGDQAVAASVIFRRDLPDRETHLQYVITVEAKADRKMDVLPALGEAVKSVRLLTVVRPIDMPAKETGKPLESPDGLVAMRVPHGWYAQITPVGMSMAQTDYTLAAQPGLSAYVLVADVAADMTLARHVEQCTQAAMQAAREQGMEGRIVSQGTARLGTAEACQLVFEQRVPPPTSEPTTAAARQSSPQAATGPTPSTAAAAEPSNVVIVQRSVMLPPSTVTAKESPAAGSKPRCLSLVLVCMGARPAAAEAVMDSLAGGIQIRAAVQSAACPTTESAPATAPTIEK